MQVSEVEATTSNGPDMDVEARAKAIRAGARMSIPGMAIMSVVLVFVHIWFRPRVQTPLHLDLWLAFMGGVVLFWSASMVAFARQRPEATETVATWAVCGKVIQAGLNIGIAASPWVLLPGTDPALQYFTTMMYVWYVGVTTMTSNAGVPISRWEVALLTLSSASFALTQTTPYSIPVALLIVLIGLTMLGLRRLVQSTVSAALAAEVLSAQAAAATREALATVAGERDSKTRFIASASHDLQQPLAAAALYLEAAVASGQGEVRERAIMGVRSSLASTTALIDSMLDHLRLEAGAAEAKVGEVPIDPLLQAVAIQHQPSAIAAGIALVVKSGRGQILADAAMVRRALGNLVANAVRHSGGSRVVVGARRRSSVVDIWVIDDGRGMPPGHEEWLFTDYGAGPADTAGLGLGLASVRRQAELLGGSVALDTRWRRGAAFRLTLPSA